MKRETKIIGVVGYGLIGGSLGLALKKYTDNYVIAIDKNKETLDYIKKNNLADEVSEVNGEILQKCDVVFIGLYPEDILSFMDEYSNNFKNNTIVVDLCGIKQFVVGRYGNLKNSHFKFIGAHPMAGKEKNGITVADADLYKGASFLLTPTDTVDDEALEYIKYLAKKVGFEKIVVTTDINHDKMITYTSQLPHVMSVAYVLQEAHGKCDGYYAGSFKDMTRVADINSILWTQLFKNNKEILTEQIDEYIESLELIKKYINSDGDELKELLVKSKKLKEWQDENYKY